MTRKSNTASAQVVEIPRADLTANPFENSMLVQVSLGKIGNTRKVSNSNIKAKPFRCPSCKNQSPAKERCKRCEGAGKIEPDKAYLRASKKLFISPEYQAIESYDGETRKWFEDVALPSYFAPGIYQVALHNVRKATDYLDERIAGRKPLVEAFMQKYDGYIDEAREAVGPELFNPKDYYTHDEARGYFRMGYRLIEIGTPGSLQSIDRELFEKERGKIVGWWQDMKQGAETMLVGKMKEVVDHALDRLAGGPGGKPQIFRDTMTEKITHFLETFDDLNAITNSNELKALKQTMQAAMEGVDAQELRDSKRTRKEVVETFERIQAQLETMMVPKGRAFSIDEN